MSSPSSNDSQVIPVPPGMTVEQYLDLQGHLVSIAITGAVGFSLLVWDYINLLPDEIKLYRSSGNSLWKTPAAYAFIAVRYSGLLSAFPGLFFTAVQSNHCKVAVGLSQAGVVLVMASAGIIFGYRVSAIWNGNRIVQAIVVFFYLYMVSSWIAVATQYHVINGPPTPYASNCRMLPIVTWAPVCYASSVVFDLVILILSLTKLKANASGVGFIVYRDSLMYFFVTTITNVAVLAVQALPLKYALVKPTAVSFSPVMVVTMSSRVFLNLKLFNQRQARAEQGLPISLDSYHSDDPRTNDKFARHPMPVHPRPPHITNSPIGGSRPLPAMPVDITRETFVAL